ncbi:Uncharacterised protein [Bordetella pertussis]|nr:Uncharacterised protein [Bordetella pertussis]
MRLPNALDSAYHNPCTAPSPPVSSAAAAVDEYPVLTRPQAPPGCCASP